MREANRGGGESENRGRVRRGRKEDKTQRTLDPILNTDPPDALDVRMCTAVRLRHDAAGGADVRFERGGRVEKEDISLCGGVDG
jgi:hypothetical protein